MSDLGTVDMAVGAGIPWKHDKDEGDNSGTAGDLHEYTCTCRESGLCS